MFGWFRSKPKCPIDDETRQWIDERWEWIKTEFGRERLQKTRVVLPTAEFFPDDYDGSEAAVRPLLDRVCGFMDLDPATIDLWFYRDYETGGLYEEEEGRFHVAIEDAQRQEPYSLVAVIGHELGHVHLLGHKRIAADAEDHEPLTDLLLVFFGLGTIAANSVVFEHNWRDGQWSFSNMRRKGYLTMPVFGYALALFARDRQEESAAWTRELRLDVRAAFKQSLKLLRYESSVRTGQRLAD